VPKTAYEFGGPLTTAERDRVINMCAANRRRGVSPDAAFRLLHSARPNLIVHLVNKLRGIAFDAGEDGFSFQRVN
jgi:hypothetical protein